MPPAAPAEIKLLGPDDLGLLLAIPPGLFDHPVDTAQARAFLDSPLHTLVLALVGGQAVAFASGTVLLQAEQAGEDFVVGQGAGVAVAAHPYGLSQLAPTQLPLQASLWPCRRIPRTADASKSGG